MKRGGTKLTDTLGNRLKDIRPPWWTTRMAIGLESHAEVHELLDDLLAGVAEFGPAAWKTLTDGKRWLGRR